MVDKKEGATMTCNNCDTDLICRKKDYGGNYKATLQWQNEDGTAHYLTKDGKNFTCVIPEDEREKIVAEHDPSNQSLDGFDTPTKQDDSKMQELIVKVFKPDEIISKYENIDKLIASEYMVKLKFTERGIEPNVQKIGLYMKLLRGMEINCSS